MDKTMDDKLMCIPNDYLQKKTSTVDYNKWLKRIDIPLNEPTNQNSIKVVMQTNKKTLLLKFGD